MPKARGNKLVVDELDALDYAEEDAEYQRWEEKLVKEGKEIPKVKKPAPTSKPTEAKVTTKKIKAKEPQPKPIVQEDLPKEDEEIILEPVDDWEAAMDALDAKVAQEEAKKSQQRK